MVKLRLFALQFFVYSLLLILTSCAGQQTVPSENDAGKTADAEQKMSSSSQAAKTSATESVEVVVATPKEPEPPTVETIPRQEAESPAVELEPLTPVEPAKQSETAKTQEVSEPPKAPKQEVTQSASSGKEASAPKLELPSDPNTFLVTVGPKGETHPYLGKGHKMGFLVNGVSGKQLVLERGKTYTFDIQTDAKHDVYLSRKEIGWGASPITEGVTGAYTYKGKMTFTPTNSTPDKVFYSCRNHPHMGALIQIVNPGEKGNISAQTTTSGSSATVAPTAPKANVSESAVNQKLMFAEMMVNSQGAKRVSASQSDEAKKLLEQAKAALAEGRSKSKSGAFPEALAKADESLKLMSEATRLVPSQAAQEQLKENYKSLLAEITDYQKSHKDNLERLQKTGSVSDEMRYDESKVAAQISEAKSLADKNNFVRANAILGDVQKTITGALHKMLDSQTIVYDLNFETAEEEYQYEYKRYISYEELIPVAIEAKKPAPGAVKLMQSFVDKARKRKDEAVAKAKAGEYPDAIAMLQQATKTVRRALRMVGVMQ